MLFFVPVGFLLPLAWTRLRSFGATLLVGLCITVSIELVQLLMTLTLPVWPRWADVDDVVLNTVGTAAGWSIWRLTLGRRRADPGPHAVSR